jgi:hypothetical protein
MEADESYSSDEAQPPSCIAPNASDGQDASPVSSLKGLAESVSSYLCSVVSLTSSVSCFFITFISLGYSCVHESFVEQGMPICFYKQSSNIKGGVLQ